ncbi:hypothetical protein GYMLUDRAFT_53878 [Collybiopsis luxurians FD-317 M1]|nr:hypothetical protein GYMLUDRAFT_53878 [Collybiopsis luxurians FD-317 M1]
MTSKWRAANQVSSFLPTAPALISRYRYRDIAGSRVLAELNEAFNAKYSDCVYHRRPNHLCRRLKDIFRSVDSSGNPDIIPGNTGRGGLNYDVSFSKLNSQLLRSHSTSCWHGPDGGMSELGGLGNNMLGGQVSSSVSTNSPLSLQSPSPPFSELDALEREEVLLEAELRAKYAEMLR